MIKGSWDHTMELDIICPIALLSICTEAQGIILLQLLIVHERRATLDKKYHQWGIVGELQNV